MIGLPDTLLPARAAAQLRAYQTEVDAPTDYAARVELAKQLWPRKNKSASKTFQSVRETLAGMCSGHKRCCYCEDSCADEIEHIYPKDLFPEMAFVWANYLYACGACNVEKRNNFAVFTDLTGSAWTDVKRAVNTLVLPPLSGDSVLINPRTENPADYLLLDLTGTFRFYSLPGIDARSKARADYTINVLGLNERDHLVAGRRDAFVSYRAILYEYVMLKSERTPQKERQHRIDAIKRHPHATVWQEMKRWYQKFPAVSLPSVTHLFAQAPEALFW